MDVTPLIPEGRQIIQSYSGDGIKVSGTVFTGAVLVFPERSLVWDIDGDFSALSEKSFQPLIDAAQDIDVVLLGTGARGQFFAPALKAALKARGLQIESMDTGAACRTYNVLMAEGRRVVAALMPVL